MLKKHFFSIVIVVLSSPAFTQFIQSGILDVGNSTISSGMYARPALVSQYIKNEFHGSAGFQWTFSNVERRNFSGYNISAGADFLLKEMPVTADLFYRNNPYSSLTRESNFGFICSHSLPHLEFKLGYHMRHYSLRRGADELSDLDPDADLAIWEYRNFIYRATYSLKETNATWNISVSLTNYDHFLIQQETNPLFSIQGCYQLTEALSISAEIWSQNSGMLNLHPNYYGYYLRTGVAWKFGE